MSLVKAWLDAKTAEQDAQKKRREIEDQILASYGDIESIEDGGITLKITVRENKKIDSDCLQELAAEYGLSDHLGSLFRWKAEINKKIWEAADEKITRPLFGAITTTLGRPSFAVVKEKKS